MMKKKVSWRIKKTISGATISEVLLAFCLLSISLAPLYSLYSFLRPPPERSNAELGAVLLAQHVMEEIIAFKLANPGTLPPMTPDEPLVAKEADYSQISQYFQGILGNQRGISIDDDPILYGILSPYRCRVDTYYLEDQLYKVIVYISYQEESRQKRVYLERLLDQRPAQSIALTEAPQ